MMESWCGHEIGGEEITGSGYWHGRWMDGWRAERTAWWVVHLGHRAGVKHIAVRDIFNP